MNEYRVALESPTPGYQIFRYPGDVYVLESIDGYDYEARSIDEIYDFLKEKKLI